MIDPVSYFDERTVVAEQVPMFISAWSSNHHQEAYDLARSMKKYAGIYPHQRKLLVYNLGLSDGEMNDYVRAFGNVTDIFFRFLLR